MPFDGNTGRDLLVPSLENLAFMLRHPETWPEGFEWDYGCYAGCAVGLAHRLWGVDRPAIPVSIIWYVGVGHLESPLERDRARAKTTAAEVADAIERLTAV
jgi:hypothetical protein